MFKLIISNIIAYLDTILVIIILFLFLLNKFFLKIKIIKNLYSILFCFFLFIYIFPTSQILLKKYESEYQYTDLPKSIDAIIILSGGFDHNYFNTFDQINITSTEKRIIEGFKLFNNYNQKPILLFSGISFDNNFGLKKEKDQDNEKKFFHYLFNSTDIKKKIIFENKSLNTFQNLKESKKILEKIENINNIVVVSSAFHMPRIMRIAKLLEFKIIPYQTDYKIKKINLLDSGNWTYFKLLLRIISSDLKFKFFLKKN